MRELNENAQGRATFQLNKLSALTSKEKKALLSLQTNTEETPVPSNVQLSTTPPAVLDYRSLGMVTTVKDQAFCGSCWAFAVTSHYECLMISDGQGEKDLAEQFLLQCDKSSLGCNGGYSHTPVDLAYRSGMPEEDDYPYKANDRYYSSKTICTVN